MTQNVTTPLRENHHVLSTRSLIQGVTITLDSKSPPLLPFAYKNNLITSFETNRQKLTQ